MTQKGIASHSHSYSHSHSPLLLSPGKESRSKSTSMSGSAAPWGPSAEDDHSLGVTTAQHVVHRLPELLQGVGLCDELIEPQFPAFIKRKNTREIPTGHAAAIERR